MSRYEFATAIARIIPMISSKTEVDLSQYVKKSELPAGTDISKLASKADVDAIRKLVDEFRDELAAMGVDIDALKRDMAALAARVEALEAEQKRVRISGNVNVIGIADVNKASDNAEVFDIDNRPIDGEAKLGRTINVLTDFDLNIVGRVSDSVTANALINYGNYLNYISKVDDFGADSRLDTANDESSYEFYPYYLYINAAMGNGTVMAGRFPMQLTPYTLKRPDVDSYTNIIKTDDGNYPVDGISWAQKFGGVDVTLFAVKHENNKWLRNGLTAGAIFHDAGGEMAVGSLLNASQTVGGRVVVATPWEGKFGATFYQTWSRDGYNASESDYDQARVYGADLALKIASNWDFAASWTQSDTLAKDGSSAADIDDDNTAWDAKIGTKLGKLGIGAGYKDIERNFAAAGSWDKIGAWPNPTNVKGWYADFCYPFASNLKLTASGEMLKIRDTIPSFVSDYNFFNQDDEIIKAEAAVKWGFSATNTLDLGVQWVKYDPDTAGVDSAKESYSTSDGPSRLAIIPA